MEKKKSIKYIVVAGICVAVLALLVLWWSTLKDESLKKFTLQLAITLSIILLVVDSILLIVLVILQDQKAGGLPGVYGGGGLTETMIGPKVGQHLTKITTMLVTFFFVLILIAGFLFRAQAAINKPPEELLGLESGSAAEETPETTEQGTATPNSEAPGTAAPSTEVPGTINETAIPVPATPSSNGEGETATNSSQEAPVDNQ